MNDGKSIEQIVQEAAETGESYGRYVARTELARLQAHYAEAKGRHRHKKRAKETSACAIERGDGKDGEV